MLSQPQGHSAAGKITSMKNSNDTIANRTRNLPACSTVPQPTVPPHAPVLCSINANYSPMNAQVIVLKPILKFILK